MGSIVSFADDIIDTLRRDPAPCRNHGPMSASLYVQYGCGFSAPREWRNFDASPTLRFERVPLVGRLYTRNASRFPANVEYGDIVRGLPIPGESCQGVYCSHVLEHLSLNDFRVALRRTKEILRPGGIFRLVLPDLEFLATRYVNSPAHDAAIHFMRDTYLGYESRARGIKAVAQSWFGNSRHLWMWDYRSIQLELRNAGFDGVRRASFGDCSDPMFKAVEDQSRWENALGVECRNR